MAGSLTNVCARLLRGVSGGRLTQVWQQGISSSLALRCEAEEGEGEADPYANIPPEKLRLKVIPVETSMKYLQSEAYKTTYGNEPVWKKYRRNFKGQRPPFKTRKMCIRNNIISTGNPCPICRDEYLVLDPINTNLLKQFISPHNSAILPALTTNLCQKRQKELEVAILKARDIGLLTFDVPFRHYHYPDYYPPSMTEGATTSTSSTASSSTPAAAVSESIASSSTVASS